MIKRTLLLMGIAALLCWPLFSRAQTSPVSYYTCDSTQLTGAILDNFAVFNMSLPGSTYQITTGGKVGKYMTWGAGTTLLNGSATTTTISGSFTIEYIWRAGYDFNTCEVFKKANGAWSFKFNKPENNNCTPLFEFNVNTGANSKLTIPLNGSDRRSVHYYLDGKWHHFAFTYNASNGIRKMYVDGICAAGFTDTISGTPITSGNNQIQWNSTASYRRCFMDIDEIAQYASAISAAQVYNNYLRFTSGLHYDFTAFVGIIPTVSVSSGIDSLEFAPGTILPTAGVSTTGMNTTALNQLIDYANPRYKRGMTLQPNFNWCALDYMAGSYQPGQTTDSIARNARELNGQLAARWNYMLLLNVNSGSNLSQYTDTTKLVGKLVKQANLHPELKAGVITFWSQLAPQTAGFTSGGSYAFRKTLPPAYYVKNESGAYLDINGNVTVTPTNYVLSPECPLDSIVKDGLTQNYYLNTLRAALTRRLDFISENDEVVPAWGDLLLSKDPVVTAKMVASGLSWNDYKGKKRFEITATYRDNALSGFNPKPAFQVYKVEGRGVVAYKQYRGINNPINSQIFATPDLYFRRFSNWRNWNGPDNGMQHMIEGRNIELPLNDKLCAPFVSAGWNEVEEANMRPGDYLGLLKLSTIMGAEFFHSGYFNTNSSYNLPNPPPADPRAYIWQLVMPSYAQAAISRAQDFLFNGTLMPGNTPMGYDPPKAGVGYTFKSGNLHEPVAARKLNSGAAYLITGCIPRVDIDKNNAPLLDTVTSTIDGDTLQFTIRRQGSMYVYDKRDPANILFYQLDAWHETTHPQRWSNDIKLEAELYDSCGTTVKMQTYKKFAGKGDYRNFFTYIKVPPKAGVTYQIQPRKAAFYWIYVRAKANTTANTGLLFDIGMERYSMNGVVSTGWKWYKVPVGRMESINYNLKAVSFAGTVLVDKMFISDQIYSDAALDAQ